MRETLVTEDALQYATERIEQFASVQQHRDWPEKLEAITVLLEGLGLSEEGKLMFTDWVDKFVGESGSSPDILLGFLLGLFVRQYDDDSA